MAPSAGAVTEPVGAPLSTVFAERSVVVVLWARSVTLKRRSYAPSETDVVSHVTLYGSEVAVPIVCQSPAPAGE